MLWSVSIVLGILLSFCAFTYINRAILDANFRRIAARHHGNYVRARLLQSPRRRHVLLSGDAIPLRVDIRLGESSHDPDRLRATIALPIDEHVTLAVYHAYFLSDHLGSALNGQFVQTDDAPFDRRFHVKSNAPTWAARVLATHPNIARAFATPPTSS